MSGVSCTRSQRRLTEADCVWSTWYAFAEKVRMLSVRWEEYNYRGGGVNRVDAVRMRNHKERN